MISLAINTATLKTSLALGEEGKGILEILSLPEAKDHGKSLFAGLESLLTRHRLTYNDIGLFAAVTGPGSFTGIRLGLSIARGLALAAQKPVVGVSSFEMFATEPEKAVWNIVAVESWRSELYFQVYDEEGKEALAPLNATPEDFLAQVRLPDQKIVLSGDAQEKLKPLMPDARMSDVERGADQAALIALAKYKRGKKEKPAPFYMREADVTISNVTGHSLKEETVQ